MDKFGERLRAARTRRHLSQEKLALAAGLKGQNAISNYERAKRSPRMEVVDALVEALGGNARAELAGTTTQPQTGAPSAPHATPELGDVALLLGYVAQALARTSPRAAEYLSRAVESLPAHKRASDFVRSFAESIQTQATQISAQSRGSTRQ